MTAISGFTIVKVPCNKTAPAALPVPKKEVREKPDAKRQQTRAYINSIGVLCKALWRGAQGDEMSPARDPVAMSIIQKIVLPLPFRATDHNPLFTEGDPSKQPHSHPISFITPFLREGIGSDRFKKNERMGEVAQEFGSLHLLPDSLRGTTQ